MAPYAVAHFKIGLELSGRHLLELQRDVWAYHFKGNERINIYLTNTLEGIEHVTHQAGPLAALTKEANEASAVKRHRPVLVVLGNPPYSNFGRQNRNDFILGLLDDYKRGLKEKKINLDTTLSNSFDGLIGELSKQDVELSVTSFRMYSSMAPHTVECERVC